MAAFACEMWRRCASDGELTLPASLSLTCCCAPERIACSQSVESPPPPTAQSTSDQQPSACSHVYHWVSRRDSIWATTRENFPEASAGRVKLLCCLHSRPKEVTPAVVRPDSSAAPALGGPPVEAGCGDTLGGSVSPTEATPAVGSSVEVSVSDDGEALEPSSVSEKTSPRKKSLASESQASTPVAEARGELEGPPTGAVSRGGTAAAAAASSTGTSQDQV